MPRPSATTPTNDNRPQPPTPRAWIATTTAAVSWLCAGAVVFGAAAGFGRLQDHVSQQVRSSSDVSPAHRSHPAFVVHWPPMPESAVAEARRRGYEGPVTWLDRDSRLQIEGIVRTLATPDPFDRNALASIHTALMSTGWFAEPVRVSRRRDGTIDVQGAWRVPAAAVRTDTGDRLVTGAGRLLSPKYLHDRSGLKLILGATGDAPALGEPWPVGDVQAGLELLEYLRAMPGYEQVYGVDVSRFLSTGSLVVMTTTGTRVLWGGRVGEFHPGQAPDEAKRLRLAELFVRFGRIDAGQAIIDLRTEDGPYIVLRDPAGSVANNTR